MPSGMWSYKHDHDGVEVEDRFYFGCKNYGIARLWNSLHQPEELEDNRNIRKGLNLFTGSYKVPHLILDRYFYKPHQGMTFQTKIK